jgi:RNA polymerase sigma-70 factor (ECF subfamily)
MVVRDELMADELAQDAIVRLLNGDFAGADPSRGRFRDLLKTSLRNMARNNWAKEKRRTGVDFDLSLVDDADSKKLEDQWTGRWREQLLTLAWDKLKSWEQTHSDSVSYQILKLRSDHPDDASPDLAKRLSAATGREFKPDAARQQLRRARVRFVEFLVAEIADGLPEAGPEQLQEELISLGLFASVKDVLPAKWQV